MNYSFRVTQSFENGLYLDLDERIHQLNRPSFKSKNKLYENLDDFISDNTKESDVELANYSETFLYYFTLLVSILFVFILQQLYWLINGGKIETKKRKSNRIRHIYLRKI